MPTRSFTRFSFELARIEESPECDAVLWPMSWQSWVRIGLSGSLPRDGPFLPSQMFLTTLCSLLPDLFRRVTKSFTKNDFSQLSTVLQQSLVCPILSDAKTPYILPTNYYDSGLTPLQEVVIAALETFSGSFLGGPENLRPLLAPLFSLLLTFATYAVHTPKPSKLGDVLQASGRGENYVSLSYVAFGERCFDMTVSLYKDCGTQPLVIDAGVLEQIFKALRQPLSMKYNCPSQSTWRLAYKCLTIIMTSGTEIARKQPSKYEGMWDALALCLEDFLFAPHKYPPGLSVEDFEEHEALDCGLIAQVRDVFLSRPEGVPEDFTERLISLLNRGSIHSVPANMASEFDLQRWLREELAQLCFHTLLSYSFSAAGEAAAASRGAVSRAAVRTILNRCRDVLARFVEDQRLSGQCPLPRARLTEVGLSLKALSSLITAFKKAPEGRIDPAAWRSLLDCYPVVVDSVLPNCTLFLKPLKDLLHLYADLLQPPSKS